MKHALARTALALTALVATSHALAENVEVGTVQQIAPRPLIAYTGAYASYVTSSLVANPIQRTLVTIDLYGIMQAAGLTWLERIDVLDGGGNQYGGSPGADVDYWRLNGAASDVTTSFSYTGANAVHVGESSTSLALRTSLMFQATKTSIRFTSSRSGRTGCFRRHSRCLLRRAVVAAEVAEVVVVPHRVKRRAAVGCRAADHSTFFRRCPD